MKHLKYFLFTAVVLLTFLGATAQIDKQKELEEKRQSLLEEIKNIKSFLFKTQGQKKSVLTEVQDLGQQITARENLIRITNQQANFLTREINNNLTKIDDLREELKKLKEDYGAMIRKSYKSKSQQSRVMFLLSSEDFLQAYKRLQYMKQYAKHRKMQGEKIKDKTNLLQVLNQDLVDQKKQKEKLIDDNRVAKRALDKEKKDQESLMATLRKDEGKFSSQIKEKQRETAAIDKQIDAIIRAEIAKSNAKSGTKTTTTAKPNTFALTPEAKALANDFTNNKGKLPWPVDKGIVVGRYGTHQDPLLPNVTRSSSGVEIATGANESAQAVFDGEVFQIQRIKGTPKMALYVRHGNYITVYMNLESVSVKVGDKVTTKQKIGKVFTNTLDNKTILKFLMYKESNKMNPADWIYRM